MHNSIGTSSYVSVLIVFEFVFVFVFVFVLDWYISSQVSVCVGSSDQWLCVARLPPNLSEEAFLKLASNYGKVCKTGAFRLCQTFFQKKVNPLHFTGEISVPDGERVNGPFKGLRTDQVSEQRGSGTSKTTSG